MDDTIYRQAAIDAIATMDAVGYSPYATIGRLDALLALNRLPSAERRGQWIAVENDIDYYPFMCSECYETVTKKTNYCPRCGTRMVEK